MEKFLSLDILRRLWLVIQYNRYITFCYSPQQRHLGRKLSYCCAGLGSSYCRGIGIVEGQICKCVEVTCNGLKFIRSSIQIMLTFVVQEHIGTQVVCGFFTRSTYTVQLIRLHFLHRAHPQVYSHVNRVKVVTMNTMKVYWGSGCRSTAPLIQC
jgi:hypothetical protein